MTTRLQLALCGALTVQFSMLSIALDYYATIIAHDDDSEDSLPVPLPSIAILVTELGKVLVSLLLVASSGELRDAIKERTRIRDELLALAQEEEEEERTTLLLEHDQPDDEDLVVVPLRGDRGGGGGLAPTSSSTPRRGGGGLSINVERANASSTSTSTPSLTLIPATPLAPEPSPTTRILPLEVSLLFPSRPSSQSQGRRDCDSSSCWAMMLNDIRNVEWWHVVKSSVLTRTRRRRRRRGRCDVSSVAIVGILYALQNRAQISAATNLSVPMFQLAYQLKVSPFSPREILGERGERERGGGRGLTFVSSSLRLLLLVSFPLQIPANVMGSVILLDRSLSVQEWWSLFTLTLGVGIVQLCSVLAADDEQRSPLSNYDRRGFVVGLSAVLLGCLSSGFASCHFERILKTPSSSSSTTLPPLSLSKPSRPPRLTTTTTPTSSSSSCDSPALPNSTSRLEPMIPTTSTAATLSSIVPSKPSLWIRNIQLSLVGVAASVPLTLYDLDYVMNSYSTGGGGGTTKTILVRVVIGEIFRGFRNPIVWIVIVLQIIGGLLTGQSQYINNLSLSSTHQLREGGKKKKTERTWGS